MIIYIKEIMVLWKSTMEKERSWCKNYIFRTTIKKIVYFNILAKKDSNIMSVNSLYNLFYLIGIQTMVCIRIHQNKFPNSNSRNYKMMI